MRTSLGWLAAGAFLGMVAMPTAAAAQTPATFQELATSGELQAGQRVDVTVVNG
jgi:hypothetical protein